MTEPCNIVVADNGTTHKCVICLTSNEGSRPACLLKQDHVQAALADQPGHAPPVSPVAPEVSEPAEAAPAPADAPRDPTEWPTHQLAADGDNVIALRSRAAGQGDEAWRGHRDTTPNPDIISMCETLLERAKAGHIRGLAFAVTQLHPPEPELGIATGWWNSPNAERWALMGAVAHLGHRMSDAADGKGD